jgi:DNA-binding transcriptional LysR family regulator
MDLNLLKALDVLLKEKSVTKAADAMNVSVPAMSRTLARIRSVAGDPVLTRAGRELVPTEWALSQQGRLSALVVEAENILSNKARVVPELLERTFILRAADGFPGVFGARIAAEIQETAPLAIVRFAPQGDEDVAALREGKVDLDIGPLGALGPEIRTQLLYRDRFVGVVREGHELARGKVSEKRFAGHLHISVSRRGRARGRIDETLRELGLERRVVLITPSFYAAIVAASQSDLVATAPGRIAASIAKHLPIRVFSLPFPNVGLDMHQAWHPRFHEAPAHKWLRECVRKVTRDVERR